MELRTFLHSFLQDYKSRGSCRAWDKEQHSNTNALVKAGQVQPNATLPQPKGRAWEEEKKQMFEKGIHFPYKASQAKP